MSRFKKILWGVVIVALCIWLRHLNDIDQQKDTHIEPTALCYDGTYSYSEHDEGTCSHHGGVERWWPESYEPLDLTGGAY